MSDPTNVFDDDTNPQVTPAKETTNENPFADQLSAIVNDGGEQKYSTVEKALEALKASQDYIPTLKTSLEDSQKRVEDLEKQLAERDALDEVVEKITGASPKPEEKPSAPELSEEKVINLIKSYEQASRVEAAKAANGEKVANVLEKKFGDKTKEVVQKKAEELGTTPSRLGELAKESPEVVLQLFNEGSAGAGPTTESIKMPLDAPQNKSTLELPSKSLLSGASAKDQAEFMRKIKEEVYKDLDVQV